MLRRVWDCPCGNFRLVVRRPMRRKKIDAILGKHYLECVVAQADVILRRPAG